MDARPLDVLPDDLPTHDVRGDDVRGALWIDAIIQSGRAPRARQGRKPAPQHRRRLTGEDLSHQHIGALGASPEATLPHLLGVLSRTVRLERGLEHVVEHGRAAPAAALGPAANHDLELTDHRFLSVTGTRRRVNRRPRAVTS
jgi:hypothetical protein